MAVAPGPDGSCIETDTSDSGTLVGDEPPTHLDAGSRPLPTQSDTTDAPAPDVSNSNADASVHPAPDEDTTVAVQADAGVGWTAAFGGGNSDELLHATSVNPEGTVAAVGITDLSLDGENQGWHDIVASLYDARGNEKWTRQLGSSEDDSARDVVLHRSGEVWLLGDTAGALAEESLGGRDVVVARFDMLGRTLWTTQWGTPSEDSAKAIGLDPGGRAWIVGSTYGQLGATMYGSSDIFVAAVSAEGGLVHTSQYGTAESDTASAVSVAADGDVAVLGWTRGELGAPLIGENAGVVIILDASGNLRWQQNIQWAEVNYATAIAWDAAKNLYVAGFAFDLPSDLEAPYDVFLSKFTSEGTPTWTQRIATTHRGVGPHLGIDTQGRVFVVLDDDQTRILAIDSEDGELLWTSPSSTARGAQALAVTSEGSVLLSGGILEGTKQLNNWVVVDHFVPVIP